MVHRTGVRYKRLSITFLSPLALRYPLLRNPTRPATEGRVTT